jgi:hypothetical protein
VAERSGPPATSIFFPNPALISVKMPTDTIVLRTSTRSLELF